MKKIDSKTRMFVLSEELYQSHFDSNKSKKGLIEKKLAILEHEM
jgi:hypothetical protein